ncbi:hypothetical protein ES703_45445 [subsurface metagenome]
MCRRDTFVAEDAPHLVDFIEPADDESLEVELQGDTQVEVLVESIMVRYKRRGEGAPGGRM